MADLFYGFAEEKPINQCIVDGMKKYAEEYHISHKGDYFKGYFSKEEGDVLTLITIVFRYFLENPTHINHVKALYFIENDMIMEDCVESMKKVFDKKGIAYEG